VEEEETEFEREWWGRKSRGMCMLTAVMACWERIVGVGPAEEGERAARGGRGRRGMYAALSSPRREPVK
jgi:hypothetical protein